MDATACKEEKNSEIKPSPTFSDSEHDEKVEEGEVFSAGEDGVNFRTVGWIRGEFGRIPVPELY